MDIIEALKISKSYGNVKALRDVTFRVRKGEVFGLLGPNGAGKTTTLEILEGLKSQDSGDVEILGMNLKKNKKKIRNKIGVVLQKNNFFPMLTLRETMKLYSAFYDDTYSVDNLLKRFKLRKLADRQYDQLSGGQRQRFVLALSVMNKPEILFLDEPTVGLDPAVRQNIWDVIMDLTKNGLTILLTTHYMEEAEILCDRVGIIDNGKLLMNDKPVKLINDLGVVSKIKFMCSKTINVADLEQLPGVLSARRDKYTYDLETDKPEVSLRELLEWEKQFSGKVFNLQVRQATLEDVFLKLTGHTLRK